MVFCPLHHSWLGTLSVWDGEKAQRRQSQNGMSSSPTPPLLPDLSQNPFSPKPQARGRLMGASQCCGLPSPLTRLPSPGRTSPWAAAPPMPSPLSLPLRLDLASLESGALKERHFQNFSGQGGWAEVGGEQVRGARALFSCSFRPFSASST